MIRIGFPIKTQMAQTLTINRNSSYNRTRFNTHTHARTHARTHSFIILHYFDFYNESTSTVLLQNSYNEILQTRRHLL